MLYDAALSFGKRTIAAGQFPDVLNLGAVAGTNDTYPGKGFTSVDRLTVDVCCDAPAGGTGITVTVEDSADGSAGWAALGSRGFTLAEMKAGPCQVAVSPNRNQYLRVSLAVTGTFTGNAEAILNTYAGK
jgi:hypothetical protein